MIKILITGDRNWKDHIVIGEAILRAVKESNIVNSAHEVTIVHGGARGADTIAGEIGEQFGFKVRRMPAQWEKYGRAAGPIRNQQMLDENKDIDICLSFHHNLELSKGTRDMVNRVNKAGISHRHYDGRNDPD